MLIKNFTKNFSRKLDKTHLVKTLGSTEKNKTNENISIKPNFLNKLSSDMTNEAKILDSGKPIQTSIHFKDHYPVMWKKILKLIEDHVYSGNLEANTLSNKYFGDFTLGCGNHTKLILDNFDKSHVVGVELDSKMVDYTSKKLDRYIQKDRLIIIEDSYVCVEELKLCELFDAVPGILDKQKFHCMLVDLGYNSMQLEDKHKGISFKNPQAYLDMRYDTENETKAKASDILNNSSELELMEIFSKYGDEKNHEAIAKNIIKFRESKKFIYVEDFVNVINDTYENSKNETKFNIYKRLFQALRVCVNYELVNIQRFLNRAFFNLENEGILIIISFQSAEDKIVSNVFKELERMKLGKILFTKVIKPDKEELEENSRSHSAMLRAIKFTM
jgi:16S rRNA (cytosine1402-N4)-methyltransferase